jgi:hypothetical protein
VVGKKREGNNGESDSRVSKGEKSAGPSRPTNGETLVRWPEEGKSFWSEANGESSSGVV